MNKHDLIQQLSLQKHSEGGYYSESYRSPITIQTHRIGIDRATMTSIYYLLTDDSPIDVLHLNKSDIIHYFHLGSPITYLVVDPEGILQKFTLGLDLNKGELPQLLIPGDYWKAAVLKKGEFGLLGEAVAPGFDSRDREFADSKTFFQKFPHLWDSLATYIKKE